MHKTTRLFAVLFAFCIVTVGAALAEPVKTRVSFPGVDVGAGGTAARIVAELTRPAGDGPFPAVVLLHTAAGVTQQVSEDWPAYFAGIGYATLTVDSFGSRGIERFAKNAVSAEAMAADAYAAAKFLAGQPVIDGGRIGVMGFSMGAFAINNQMLRPKLHKGARRQGATFAAGIGMYGPCDRLGKFGPPPFPLLQIIGDKDLFAGGCAAAKSDDFPVEILPGVYHNFDDPEDSNKTDSKGNYRVYSSEATGKAREIAREFLGKSFAAPRTGRGGGTKIAARGPGGGKSGGKKGKTPAGALTGAAAEAALAGRTISFTRAHGSFSIFFEPGGAALTRSSRAAGRTLRKKWWVDGDRFCRTFGRDNKEQCLHVKVDGDTVTFLKRNGETLYDAKLAAGNGLAK